MVNFYFHLDFLLILIKVTCNLKEIQRISRLGSEYNFFIFMFNFLEIHVYLLEVFGQIANDYIRKCYN